MRYVYVVYRESDKTNLAAFPCRQEAIAYIQQQIGWKDNYFISKVPFVVSEEE